MNKKFLLLYFLIAVLSVGMVSAAVNIDSSSIQNDTTVLDNALNIVATQTGYTSDYYMFTDVNDSLVNWWDGSSGTPIYSPDNNVFTLSGDTSIVDNCVYGSCYSFDGAGDRVGTTVNFNDEPKEQQAFTVSLWAYVNSFDNADTLMGCSDGQKCVSMGAGSGSRLGTSGFSFGYKNAPGSTYLTKVTTSVSNIPTGEWVHLVGTFETGGNIDLYVNNELLATGSASGDFNDTSSSTFYLGGFAQFFSFNGSIDEVVMMERYVTADEVAALGNATADGLNNSLALDVGSYNYTVYAKDNSSSYETSETISFSVEEYIPPLGFDETGWNGFYQRQSEYGLNFTFSGTNNTPWTDYEVQIGDGAWVSLNSISHVGNNFTAWANLPYGDGYVKLRTTSDDQVFFTSNNKFAIGDLFVIGGQSNTLTSVGSVSHDSYRWVNNDWTQDDNGRAWPRASNTISESIDVPLAFIEAGASGSALYHWLPPHVTHYPNLLSLVTNATDGTMAVRGTIFYIGETDMGTTQGFSYYQGLYTSIRDNLRDNLTFPLGDNFMVGQTHRRHDPDSTGQNWDSIQIVQASVWDLDGFLRGTTNYDIEMGGDLLHFGTEAGMAEFSRRWALAILEGFYDTGDGYGASLTNAEYISRSEGSNDSNIVKLTYDKPLEISYFNGTTSSLAKGFEFSNGVVTLNDSNVLSTEVSGNVAYIFLDTNLTGDYNFSYGNIVSAYLQPTLSASSNSIAAEMVFDEAMTFSSGVYYVNPSNNTCTTGLTSLLPVVVIMFLIGMLWFAYSLVNNPSLAAILAIILLAVLIPIIRTFTGGVC
jgi:hypothetical protein